MKSHPLAALIVAYSHSLFAAAFLCTNLSHKVHQPSSLSLSRHADSTISRRETLKTSWESAALITTALIHPEKAMAFPNKISSKYDDRPKQRGAVPKGLGVGTRKDMAGDEYLGLKPCGAGKQNSDYSHPLTKYSNSHTKKTIICANHTAPNCFCSTDSMEDDPDHSIPSWKYPNTITSQEEAFQQLYEVIKAYPPGQADIDGGGFNIVTFDPVKGYIYVQFESLKNGFIDDVELAAIGSDKSNAIQVRSSSRLGYLDYGVNAKRLNYLAKILRDKGWDARGVELSSHVGYAEENGLKSL